MLVERRKSKRLDICIIVEFKALESSMSSLGITRDFAGDGFSFESQDLDIGPGENLDFKFKNAESDLYVSTEGEIVWKRRNSEFSHLVGIRFNKLDDETRREMYEAVSATGHVPLNYLTNNNDYEDEYSEVSDPEDYATMYYDPADTDESVNEEPLNEESSPHESSMPEEQLALEVEDGNNGDSTRGNEQEAFADTYPVNIDRRKKKPLYEPIVIIIILLLLLLAAIVLFGEKDKMLESPSVQVLEEPVIAEETEPIQPEPPVVEEAPPIVNAELPKAPFLVQVGAWRNPEYSNEILPRLQIRYPDAYIVVKNNFNIIRIPGVMNRAQGLIMLEEIADKFNLTGLVVTVK